MLAKKTILKWPLRKFSYQKLWGLHIEPLSVCYQGPVLWESPGGRCPVFISKYADSSAWAHTVDTHNAFSKNVGRISLSVSVATIISHPPRSLSSILNPCALPPAGKLLSSHLTRIAVKSVLLKIHLNNSFRSFISLLHPLQVIICPFSSLKPSWFLLFSNLGVLQRKLKLPGDSSHLSSYFSRVWIPSHPRFPSF